MLAISLRLWLTAWPVTKSNGKACKREQASDKCREGKQVDDGGGKHECAHGANQREHRRKPCRQSNVRQDNRDLSQRPDEISVGHRRCETGAVLQGDQEQHRNAGEGEANDQATHGVTEAALGNGTGHDSKGGNNEA